MLKIDRVTKAYGPKTVLDALSLDIEEGKVFTLLGASGCGKTTLLRIIAGLDQPDGGRVSFRGTDWVAREQGVFVPPQRRNIGLVFQSYAIWPHMKVYDQVAYPLRNQRMDESAVRRRVTEMLRVVGLQGLEQRPGPLLSGGQQQRVALARALAPSPSLLLLDEPFSNLDVELRVQLRPEIRRIQRELGITVVLVTHDQLDAFALSDRVAVMRAGKVEQVGSCREIYDAPATDFVRAFVGRSSRVDGEVAEVAQDHWQLRLPDGACHRLPLPARPLVAGQPVGLWLRPEDVRIDAAGNDLQGLAGVVTGANYLGDRYECAVRLGSGQTLLAHAHKADRVEEGAAVRVVIQGAAVLAG